jgi:hypothetical protein
MNHLRVNVEKVFPVTKKENQIVDLTDPDIHSSMVELLQHALGLDPEKPQKKAYRNHFVAGGADVGAWDYFCSLGLAIKTQVHPELTGGDPSYAVTDHGKQVAAVVPKLMSSTMDTLRMLANVPCPKSDVSAGVARTLVSLGLIRQIKCPNPYPTSQKKRPEIDFLAISRKGAAYLDRKRSERYDTSQRLLFAEQAFLGWAAKCDVSLVGMAIGSEDQPPYQPLDLQLGDSLGPLPIYRRRFEGHTKAVRIFSLCKNNVEKPFMRYIGKTLDEALDRLFADPIHSRYLGPK